MVMWEAQLGQDPLQEKRVPMGQVEKCQRNIQGTLVLLRAYLII